MEKAFYFYCAIYLFGVIYRYIKILKEETNIIFWAKILLKNKDFRRFLKIFLINLSIKAAIDIELTPFLMINYGYFKCLLFTNIIYIFIGIFSLIIYDYYKIDICGIEALKKAQSEGKNIEDETGLIKFILKRNKKNKFFLGLLLAFKNFSLVVIYYREGFYKFNGFTKITIFFKFVLYIIIINIYWNTMVYFGISIWNLLF